MKRAPRPRVPRSRKRSPVTRDEFDNLLRLLNERADFMEETRRSLEIQFTRIAHIQAEVDDIKRTLKKTADSV